MPTSVLHLHRHRLLVQRLVARRLAIPFAGGDIVFRFPQVPLVRDIRDDLTLAQNAFMFGQPALEGDIFQILWRCHPLFMRPDGSQPNQPSGGRRVSMLRRVRAWFERRALLAHVRQCDIAGAAQAIRKRLVEDMPALIAIGPTGAVAHRDHAVRLAGRN